ncbi:hypothetical protein BGP77_02440 [Saccharospirillum sp. MSK14-1]|uniref:hypothetical protein n=1 Tax=Saccharospirillum sp. MSK14-1 TaxID=1897632 RepID=UPI000D3B2748|nr:hypothetical protein [Saccharospirillum sp. MSK14-1]PTY36191.1 hypothetical protein BGP77_02440 [Saccharospirillum sp. MSK14-1]
MRKALIFLLLTFPALSMANDFYVGFTVPGPTRAGLIIGYQFNNVNSVELGLFPGFPEALSVSIASKTYIDEEDHYVVAGYSGRSVYDRGERGPFLAVGREFFIDRHNAWSMPVEVGGGLGYSDSDDTWGFMGVYSFGWLYGVYRPE